jgi:hypothetical protein
MDCLVSCKFHACLAAGNALMAICNPECEIAGIVKSEQCGRPVTTAGIGDIPEHLQDEKDARFTVFLNH